MSDEPRRSPGFRAAEDADPELVEEIQVVIKAVGAVVDTDLPDTQYWEEVSGILVVWYANLRVASRQARREQLH